MRLPVRLMTIAGLGMVLSPLSQAMNMGPLNIQSSVGEPFKGEIIISDIPVSESPYLAANIGNAKDFSDLGVRKNAATNNLKIFSRRISEDKVAISIISLKPIDEPFFDVVIRLNDGKTPRLFNVNGTLTARDDPSKAAATRAMDVAPTRDVPITAPLVSAPAPAPLAVETVREAPLLPQPVKEEEVFTSPGESAIQALKDKDNSASTLWPPEPVAVVPVYNEAPAFQEQTVTKKKTYTASSRKSAKRKATYVVKPNDSLWKIATRISVQGKQSVPQTMKQIRSANPRAFVNGNANHLIAGVRLVLPKPIDGRKNAKGMSASQRKVQLSSIANNRATSQPASKAQLSLVAPQAPAASGKLGNNPSGNTSGKTGTAGGGIAGNNSDNASLVNNILASNQRATSLHDQLQQMNSRLETNNLQIKVQNEKLAELERRLQEKKKKATLN